MIFSYSVHLVHFVQLAVLRLSCVLGAITLLLLWTHLPWRIHWTRLKYMNISLVRMKVVHNKQPTTVCGFDAWQRRKVCLATFKIFPSIDRYPLSLLPHYIIAAPSIFSINDKTKSMPLAFSK